MNGHAARAPESPQEEDLMQLTLQLRNKNAEAKYAKFHGDDLIGTSTWQDVKAALQPKNWPSLGRIAEGVIHGTGLDGQAAATVAGSLSNYSTLRQDFINQGVKDKYDKMLHPPLTYLGDAFQYRTADGKFNSVINPHLGQAGAPYAKTVPSKTAPLGALPDPSDLFDKLMARQEGGRASESGLSSMLIYHATIIIHDIFRTNDNDKNISDSSSYLDLSPLYGYNQEMLGKIRDDKYKLGLLKPDTFAEDRLLRQPPGVCIMLVMYNRYHNYAAQQLLRINDNGRFSVPVMYEKTKLVSLIQEHLPDRNEYGQKAPLDARVRKLCDQYETEFAKAQAARPPDAPVALIYQENETEEEREEREATEKAEKAALDAIAKYEGSAVYKSLVALTEKLELHLEEKKLKLKEEGAGPGDKYEEFEAQCKGFEDAWEAARKKQDDDLFNTARLITCGMYIQVSVHDYLRALMGFHQFDTNFTLDPRADFDQKKTSRGLGNQVTVEFNLLYRFHCAISRKDEKYTEEFMKTAMGFRNPSKASLPEFLGTMAAIQQKGARDKKRGKGAPQPWEATFGIPDAPKTTPTSAAVENGTGGIPMTGVDGAGETNHSKHFTRNAITNLFDDSQMLEELTSAMDDPISNFGPRNVPRCLKAVEIMGIQQARKWETGTLNDFRDFFGLPRHATFESVTQNAEIQNALRDLYEHPDKIELYPGIFCESDARMGLDPGPSESSSALWSAIFSDAITLVRSDRFYTVDWNTNSLTSWGMKEVTPNNEVCKSSVFHRLLQRAFPGWFESDTIRFFHPFYTAKQNAIYAQAQGYANDFAETAAPQEDSDTQTKKNDSVPAAAPAKKPVKPWHLDSFDDISLVLRGAKSKNFTNPAYLYKPSLPAAVRAVLDPDQKAPSLSSESLDRYIEESEEDLKRYLEDLMKTIVMRESISMTNSTFQIDATRDFAIPVVTHYVADFLGFGDKLRRQPVDKKGSTYSEDEIYQHITNCQVFLAYNADETKWMARRRAFRKSMQTLIDLTQNGTIWEANQWDLTRALFGKRGASHMHELGVFVAKQVLEYEKDQRKAAAILLLICLDFAYNSVVSFTATLDGYMEDLYKFADSPPPTDGSKPEWVKLQKFVFGTEGEDDKEVEKMVQLMAQATVELPIVRKAIKTADYQFGWAKPGNPVKIEKGDVVVLNLSKAIAKAQGDEAKTQSIAAKKKSDADEVEFLTSQLSIADKYGVFSPRRFATLSLTSMIRFVAQMRNPRRGHDAQGRLKRVPLDSTSEGYAHFMAPGRVDWIQQQVRSLEDGGDEIWTDEVLQPRADTYLTPTWDEFVPYPMTWKIRFDGFGKSEYGVPGGHPFGRVTTAPALPDFCPPWYQPQGPSTVGGAFATVGCVCAEAEAKLKADAEGKEDGEKGGESALLPLLPTRFGEDDGGQDYAAGDGVRAG
ncbi:uncharacterized protein PG986_000074 [Apiospora aurea]|uniref:Linoleate diol synthase n=1 Tax=Apiospora aurea TaxID=335848 RepID=A0ABR1QSZ3_9PEZI